jgi:hypothetical protein
MILGAILVILFIIGFIIDIFTGDWAGFINLVSALFWVSSACLPLAG